MRTMLYNEISPLSLRNRAIGKILFFTGMRSGDIAGMLFSDIDWKKEEIKMIQTKTGNELLLPLTPIVGNAIYDYVKLLLYVRTQVTKKVHTYFGITLQLHLHHRGFHAPAISSTLGHSDPNSLDHYLYADITHLRECAISIEAYPIRDEVFQW